MLLGSILLSLCPSLYFGDLNEIQITKMRKLFKKVKEERQAENKKNYF